MAGFLHPIYCGYKVGYTSNQTNNCFNYALRRCYGDYKQPGRRYWSTMLFGMRSIPENITEDGLRDNIIWHGNKFLGKDYKDASKNCGPCNLIAAFISETDFHFYRREKNNTWSHKRGQYTPTDKDDDGHTIIYVERCSKKYPIFVGYFCR